MKNLFGIGGVILLIFLFQSCKKEENKVTDVDGNVYNTVTIGTQVWMVENLKTTRYSNGDAIPNVTANIAWSSLSTGAYCDYNNTTNNADTYGRLYNYYAVIDSRNLCPLGWHVPTFTEWTTLINDLGGIELVAAKLKAVGTTWTAPNTEATNVSGFTALPGGYRNADGSFYGGGVFAGWFSSTEVNANDAYTLGIFTDNSATSFAGYWKTAGYSIRCVD